MKYSIIIYAILLSFQTHSKEANISGCQRFELIYESLNKECSPEKIKSILAQKDNFFEEKLFAQKNEGNSLVEIFNRASSDKDITCDMANDILHPGAVLIRLASKKSCNEVIQILSTKTSNKDFALALYSPLNNSPSLLDYFFQLASEQHEEHELKKAEEKVKALFETLKILVTKIDSGCKDGEKESCKGKQEFLKIAEKIKKAADDEENYHKYLQSTDYIMDEVCPLQRELERNQLIMKTEREIGKISGTINAGNLNRAGAWIVDLKPRIEKWSKIYKEKTKKDINLQNCMNRNQN